MQSSKHKLHIRNGHASYAVLVGIVHVTSTKYTPCMINHEKCAASSDWKLATSQKTYV